MKAAGAMRSDDMSKLPKWARDRISWLAGELRRWQDLYVKLASSISSSPPYQPGTLPWMPVPPSDPKPSIPPGVYAYMCPFPTEGSTEIPTISYTGVTCNPPTGKEP
jgi:hypothetical protein